MAPANGAPFTPVQLQKLLFLIDRELSAELGGPFFDFRAYDYGPFDRRVYDILETMQAETLVEIEHSNLRKYRATQKGQRIGEEAISRVPDWLGDAIRTYSSWVRQLSFAALVSAIYKKYPDMKVNSVFQG